MCPCSLFGVIQASTQRTTSGRLQSEVRHWRHFPTAGLESACVDWETSQELQWRAGGMTSTLRAELYVKSSNRLLFSRPMHLCIVSQVQARDYSLVLCTTGRRTVMRGPVPRERRAPPTNGERPEIMRNGGWEIVQSHEIGQKLNSKARSGHAASENRGDPHTKA